MKRWGVVHECVFCGERDETRDHFFDCPYSYTLWSVIGGGLLGSTINRDWLDTLALISLNRYSSVDFILLRMVFQTAIYQLWKKINARRHHQSWLELEGILCRWFMVRSV